MQRPSLTLTLIAKNEAHNVPQLFDSIRGCFDEIVFVDTGSTDATIEVAKTWADKIETPINIQNFEWIKDFSAARNFALSHVKTDYAMWLDLDDVLVGAENFIKWRNNAMQFADYWIAKYNYALEKDGKPMVAFMRERVFNMKKGYKWNYFIHEGVQYIPGTRAQQILTWHVNHMRTESDLMSDRSRNIQIIESRISELDSRLKFYYGKELFENKMYEKAISVLLDAATLPDLALPDRIMSYQYGAYALIAQAEQMKPEFQHEKLLRAIQLAHQGLQLDNARAEFHIIIADSYLKMNELVKALPAFASAEHCIGQHMPDDKTAGVIYSFKSLYQDYPKIQKAKIYYHLGRMDEAEREAKEAWEKYKNPEAKLMIEELEKSKPLFKEKSKDELIKTDEIVITCPPHTAYPFDEEIYKTKPLGGSETALVQMAKWLKIKTGKRVIVFNTREDELDADSGVEYIPSKKLPEYFSKYLPKVHIAWRHNMKLTDATTYLWCHDLVTATVDIQQNFDKILCLSEFHKDYVSGMQGVESDKIIVTRNGLSPEKFKFERKPKDSKKLLWMSSPDRGLDRAMRVCDLVREKHPNIELHVYYGLQNLYKYGLSGLADHLKAMMAERPWVKYHGFTEQSKMYKEVSDGVVWVHPCDFIETYCITAVEMLSLGVYPVTRALGALKNTLADAEKKGQATLLPHDCVTEQEHRAYADAVIKAIDEKKWENVSLDPTTLSWESLAEDWVEFMKLGEKPDGLLESAI